MRRRFFFLLLILALSLSCNMPLGGRGTPTATGEPLFVYRTETPLPQNVTGLPKPPQTTLLPKPPGLPKQTPEGGSGGDSASTADAGQPNPHVEINVQPLKARRGEQITVSGSVVDIGLPYYSLYFTDGGAGSPVEMVRVTYGGEVRVLNDSSRLLEFVSASGEMKTCSFVLRARGAGKVSIHINATGEIHGPNGATWAGGGSDQVLVTVE